MVFDKARARARATERARYEIAGLAFEPGPWTCLSFYFVPPAC